MARTCGPCTVCCTLQGVKDGMPDGKPKPPAEPCRFLATGECSGCSIYEQRPEECRTYTCLWLDGFGRLGDRPDRIGVMFEIQHTGTPPHPYVLARTVKRGRELNDRAKKLFREIRAKGLEVAVVHPDDVRKWFSEQGWFVTIQREG